MFALNVIDLPVAAPAPKLAKPVNNYDSLVENDELLPLSEYDVIIVSYSGGKDSLAMLLHLLEMGVPREKIELWHQHIDGAPGTESGLMDWPVTGPYVKATSEALGIKLRWQWKDGGFEGEMLRENAYTRGVYFEDGDGELQFLPPSTRGKQATRLLFPQTTSDLSVRWCSAYLKIDIARRAIANDPRFKNAKILFVTGERREESAARSKYKEVESHPCNNKKRTVNQWRCVIDWSEEDVWNIIKRWRINPHPAYLLGWGRVSCQACIFGDKDQWASVRNIAPDRFARIAAYEQQFGKTIKHKESVVQQADKGKSFVAEAPKWLIDLSMGHEYTVEQFFTPDGEEWQTPAGAYKRCGGPS